MAAMRTAAYYACLALYFAGYFTLALVFTVMLPRGVE